MSAGSTVPRTARTLDDYLSAVRAAAADVDSHLVDEALDDIRAHVLEIAGPDADETAVARAIAGLGDPEEFALRLRQEFGLTARQAGSGGGSWSSGTVLGVPYEVRMPTAQRVAQRWWDPRDPRVLVPRVFGIGWDLNFGALAVRLRLIEPDAEDEPFGSVPDSALLAALLPPVMLSAFVLGSYLGVREYLPAEVPVHWNLRGEPDRFASVASALAFPLIASVASTAWAVWSVARRRPALNRGATIGFASLLSAVGAVVWALTLLGAFGVSPGAAAMPLSLLAAFGVPLGVMTALARAGRRAEVARDLADAPGAFGDARTDVPTRRQ